MVDASLLTQGTAAYQAAQVPPKVGHTDNAAQARKTAQDFEAFFLSQVLQPMFAGLDTAPPFGGGAAEKVWQSLLVDQYGKSMAESGGIGIADSVQREILRAQEIQQAIQQETRQQETKQEVQEQQ